MKKFMEIITKMAIEMIMLFFFILIVTGTIKGAFDIREFDRFFHIDKFDLAYLLSIPALALISFFCFIVTCLSENEIMLSMRRRFFIYSLSSFLVLPLTLSLAGSDNYKVFFISLSSISLFWFIATCFSKDEGIRNIGEGFLILGLYLMIFFILPLK